MADFILKKLVILIILTPLIYLPGTLAYAQAGSKVPFFFLLLALALPLTIIAKKYLKVGVFTIILLLYTVILSLVTVFASDISNSFWGGAKDMTGLLFYICAALFVLILSKQTEWDKLFSVSVFAGIITALTGYLQILGIINLMGRGSFMGNSSFMGTYLLLNVFFAIYLFFKKRKVIFILLSLVMIPPMYLFSSRAAMGATLGGFVLLGLIYLAKKYKAGKIALITIIPITLFTLLIIFNPAEEGIFRGNFTLENRAREMFFEASDGMRYIFWNQAIEGFKEKPFLGWGINDFQRVFYRHYDPDILNDKIQATLSSNNSHNVVYEKLVTTGILGLLSYIILITSVPLLLWRAYKKKEIDFYVPAVFTVAIVAHFVQILTVYDTYNSLIPLILLFGFTASIVDKKEIKIKKQLLLFVIPLSVLVIYSGFYKPLRTNYFLVGSLLETSPKQHIALSNETIRLSFDKTNTILTLAKNTRENMLFGNMKKEDTLVKHYINELEKEKSPQNWRILMEKANYYIMNGNYLKAKETLKEAQKLSPKNPQSLWLLAEVQILQNRFEEAEQTIEKFLAIKPDLNQSISLADQLMIIMEARS